MEQMHRMMEGFGSQLVTLSQGIISSQKEKDVKVMGTMPTLEAADADGFKYELARLLRYFDDAHFTDKRTWFRKVRNNLKTPKLSSTT